MQLVFRCISIIRCLSSILVIFIVLSFVDCSKSEDFLLQDDLHLPAEHLPFYFHSHSEQCHQDKFCKEKPNVCWGYEEGCEFKKSYSYSRVKCPGESNWRHFNNKEEQVQTFYDQADFGYVKERLKFTSVMCDSKEIDGSHLSCADHLRYCYAKNIFIDLKNFESSKHSNKYREDFLHEGQVGGNCNYKKSLLHSRSDHKSPLQSWAAELLAFTNFSDFKVNKANCQRIFDVPTVLIKLDAGVSMYHHFCDFLNLYISQHVNGSFHRNIQIILWDTSGMPYNDVFVETWRVFTDLPLIQLKELDGQKVCFREALFPLLARMQFGMYYNMPLVGGCEGSGLFHAFTEHVMHRLNIRQNGPLPSKIRVTFLARSTKHRKIINEEKIFKALKTVGEFEVLKIDYNYDMPFLKQLEITRNSDIFMGIHGSGLTHLLFLPDWASVFEIYNCDDPGCYSDLARLRGVKYFTWEKANKVFPEDEGHHPTLGAHQKFTNYAFDIDEFLRIVTLAADHVRSHPQFIERQEKMKEGEAKKRVEL